MPVLPDSRAPQTWILLTPLMLSAPYGAGQLPGPERSQITAPQLYTSSLNMVTLPYYSIYNQKEESKCQCLVLYMCTGGPEPLSANAIWGV